MIREIHLPLFVLAIHLVELHGQFVFAARTVVLEDLLDRPGSLFVRRQIRRPRWWREAAKQILVEFENLVGRGDGLVAAALPVLDLADQGPRPMLGPGASRHGRVFRSQDGADLEI